MERPGGVRVCVCALMVLTVGLVGWSSDPDYDSIASKIVNQAVAVQPGEVVLITGSSDQLALLEALVVETWKAGGQPTVEVGFPRANRRALTEMPMEYIKYPQWYNLAQTRLVDCFIGVGSIEDPTLFADVPEERFEAFRQANRPLRRAYQLARYRSVGLGQTGGVPTVAYANSKGIDYATMQKMFWNSVDTDYPALRRRAKAVAATMEPEAAVHVRSEAGTDLKFMIDDVSSRINCGRTDDNEVPSGPVLTWLPAGEVYTAVKTGSANGTLVIPSRTFRGMPVKDLTMKFSKGKMIKISADGDGSEAMLAYVDTLSENATLLSMLNIGINPDSQPFAGSDFASWEMGGLVSLSTGTNTWMGGSNDGPGGLNFHLLEASINIGGTEVCVNGDLTIKE